MSPAHSLASPFHFALLSVTYSASSVLHHSPTPPVSQSFFHFFGRTLSCFSSARHPGPFIILRPFSRQLSIILQLWRPEIFGKTSLTRLSLRLSILHFVCLSLCFSPPTTSLASRRLLCTYVLADVDVGLSLPPKCFGNTRDLLSCQCN